MAGRFAHSASEPTPPNRLRFTEFREKYDVWSYNMVCKMCRSYIDPGDVYIQGWDKIEHSYFPTDKPIRYRDKGKASSDQALIRRVMRTTHADLLRAQQREDEAMQYLYLDEMVPGDDSETLTRGDCVSDDKDFAAEVVRDITLPQLCADVHQAITEIENEDHRMVLLHKMGLVGEDALSGFSPSYEGVVWKRRKGQLQRALRKYQP